MTSLKPPLHSHPPSLPDASESEAGPLRRLSLTHHLQQEQQHQHHRRVSTDTAMFYKLLRKQPQLDIDATVVHYFAHLRVPTASRLEQNQVEDNENENKPRSSSTAVAPLPILAPSTMHTDELLTVFKRGDLIPVAAALEIIQRATNVMAREPNVVAVRAPVTVVGDLHGQFRDLVELFGVHGEPSVTNPFLFLGDYVDRGVCSCEIMLLLLAYKIQLPQHIHLLRGNHECRALSTYYGFRAECLKKYGLAVYNRAVKCFESMPLAATVATSFGTFLAVHGGLSPSIEHVDDINDKVNRFVEPDPSGALCDLLWADPANNEWGHQDEPFAPNRTRGCSYTFNEQVCREFLQRNGLLAIIRAHELEYAGFREHFAAPSTEDDDDPVHQIPPVITVFSAPEYCNINYNMGATLLIPWDRTVSSSGSLLEYRQHKRSVQREVPFWGLSEYDAMRQMFSDHLPFLPDDFYQLVALCRQLQATLDVAATYATPMPSSSSNVMQEKSAVGSELRSETAEAHAVAAVPHEERHSVDKTKTEADSFLPAASPCPSHTVINVSPAQKGSKAPKPRRRASTGNGIRLCSGVARFFEKYFGIHFREQPATRSTYIIEPSSLRSQSDGKKRASVDDTNINGVAPLPVDAVLTPRCSPPSPPPPPSQLKEMHVTVIPASVPMAVECPPVPSTKNTLDIFSSSQWSALRLFFSLLDVEGTGVLTEESFVVLLAEQDSDAYATQDELTVLMDVIDVNGDGLITIQDFLQFAYRALLRWKKNSSTLRSSQTATKL